jgi:two-component system alkaline phosphatase synthesis response regulator PhoP
VPRILIVDDDPKIIEAIQKSFSLEQGYVSQTVSDPDKALSEAIAYKPDLIILDIRMPGGDGRQIIKTFKSNTATKAIPVIFLTGMSSEGDRVLGLNLGADDYMTKPFGAMELLARIEAVLRRSQPQKEGLDRLEIQGLVLDRTNRQTLFKGKRILLQPREFEVLYLLASHPNRTLTRSFLIENTSSYGMDVSSRSLDTHIKNLRKKLATAGRWIQTIPKLGYCLTPE